jgi:hypothetical protein
MEHYQAQELNEIGLSVDRDGASYISSDDELFPVAIDYLDVLCFGTQQSSNLHSGKEFADVLSDEE